METLKNLIADEILPDGNLARGHIKACLALTSASDSRDPSSINPVFSLTIQRLIENCPLSRHVGFTHRPAASA